MASTDQIAGNSFRSDRVALKLAGLTALAFAFFFIVFFAYELLSSVADRSAAAMMPTEEARPLTVDPKIADDLAKVLAESAPFSQEVKDPFSDRGGLGGKAAASGPVETSTLSSIQGKLSSGQSSSGSKGSNSATGSSGAPPEGNGTKIRYESWLARLRLYGDEALDPRIFAIADLQPVGIVDGGSGQQEILFCSEAVNRTISFPVGTGFYDGWLAEPRQDGVVFSSYDRQVVRTRLWAGSLKNRGCKDPPPVDPLMNLSLEDLQKLALMKEIYR